MRALHREYAPGPEVGLRIPSRSRAHFEICDEKWALDRDYYIHWTLDRGFIIQWTLVREDIRKWTLDRDFPMYLLLRRRWAWASQSC